MNIPYLFPELNEGQQKMLERLISEREQAAVAAYKRGKPKTRRS